MKTTEKKSLDKTLRVSLETLPANVNLKVDDENNGL